jgi:hypothetical protein
MKGKQKLVKGVEVTPKVVDLTKLKLKELRELFPDVKATSTKEFLSELEGNVQAED